MAPFKQWVAILSDLSDPEVDLRALGGQLASDLEISQKDYEQLITHVAKTGFGNHLGIILESSLGKRDCPPLEYWVNLILIGFDSELGGKIWFSLIPFFDLTELILELLARFGGSNADERDRIVLAVSSMSRTTSLEIPSLDCMQSKEHLDVNRVVKAIQETLPMCTASGHENLLKGALTALQA